MIAVIVADRGLKPHGYLQSTPLNGATMLNMFEFIAGFNRVGLSQPWDLSRGLGTEHSTNDNHKIR